MLNIKDFVWVERYRPETLDDYIATDSFKTYVQSLITENKAHLILESPSPGLGKTALAKIIAKETSGEEVLFINASKDTGVDVIRERIISFISRKSLFSERKTVIMDEVDQISTLAADALKSLLETYHKYVRFIFTCNNYGKLSDPLKDRCVHINFMNIHGKPHTPERKELVKSFFNFCCKILDENDITYEVDDVVYIIKKHFKTVLRFRSVINELYNSSRVGDKLVIDNLSSGLDLSPVLKAVKLKNLRDIRQFTADYSTEWLSILEELHINFFNYFKENGSVYDICFALQDYQDRLVRAYNPEITLTDFFVTLIQLKDSIV